MEWWLKQTIICPQKPGADPDDVLLFPGYTGYLYKFFLTMEEYQEQMEQISPLRKELDMEWDLMVAGNEERFVWTDLDIPWKAGETSRSYVNGKLGGMAGYCEWTYETA